MIMPGPVSIPLPPGVASLLARLEAAGHTAYVVGGCVRDSLLGLTPGDWDICTSAMPEQTQAIFADCRQVLTGIKHGTVTVLCGGKAYEITTYREDGDYLDHRHPQDVHFVPRVEGDLARRDFTVNAMAYNPGTGLVDCFGGRQDLADHVIRCVGEPSARFGEDALRVLRAVRFAAKLDFTIDPDTARAAETQCGSVQTVSPERIFAELDKLLAGPAAGRVLAEYGRILTGALPEVAACIGCTQPGRWHCYDVWHHTAAAVGAVRRDLTPESARIVRWTMLLHDMAKPLCRTESPDGAAHFPGHNQRGARLADQILRRLRAPAALRLEVCSLVGVHDGPLPEESPAILRLLAEHGETWLGRLCAVKLADLAAHARNPAVAAREEEVRAFEEKMHFLARTGCYTLHKLQVGGGDALTAGIRPGPAVGEALHGLLEQVMDGLLPNDRAVLLLELKKYVGGKNRPE